MSFSIHFPEVKTCGARLDEGKIYVCSLVGTYMEIYGMFCIDMQIYATYTLIYRYMIINIRWRLQITVRIHFHCVLYLTHIP